MCENMRHHPDLVLCDCTFVNMEQKKQLDVVKVWSQTLLEKLLWSAKMLASVCRVCHSSREKHPSNKWLGNEVDEGYL